MNTTPPFSAMPGQLRCFNPRCGHIWIQRTLRPPVRCPRCQSRHYFNPSYPFGRRRIPAALTPQDNLIIDAPLPTTQEEKAP